MEIGTCCVMDNSAEQKKNIESELLIDWSNPEDARKAFLASEIFNRKYN